MRSRNGLFAAEVIMCEYRSCWKDEMYEKYGDVDIVQRMIHFADGLLKMLLTSSAACAKKDSTTPLPRFGTTSAMVGVTLRFVQALRPTGSFPHVTPAHTTIARTSS